MVFALAKRMIFALGRGFVRLGRYWATQFGLAYTLVWGPDAPDLAREQEEAEHWDWSIPYHWYETSR
ncbi:hypothetical protein [Microbispora bryophytorum]|uniref:Uncharacterized protein n=1 Tax=Microbispora bryophytorum TaxID=1460882 RepID=A0A8H9H3M7_9ACTN|nr:hypothetical protein [Microbispora bryophytorum]MBD3137926.1 hypothetical protein [Microbispora bryophytorum]TQS05151.1 hypothetical protein FLX07_17745 [Microbispora bryophytorum]GGO22725.1 hypothetical protein GCM10011574_51310 [Microbispora bryophytorum]